jgi:hypothetical protein
MGNILNYCIEITSFIDFAYVVSTRDKFVKHYFNLFLFKLL